MSGSIFVLDKNNTITELKATQYSSEDIFQELIEKYPNILAGDQITPDNPRKWMKKSGSTNARLCSKCN